MKSQLANFEKQLSKHTLEHTLELIQEGKLTAYYLRGPEGGRMMSTLIVFTPEGIVLQGDLTPERNGSVSSMGYGLNWFAGTLSDTYLCEKFLTKRFVLELAIDQLSDPVKNYYCDVEGEDLEALKALAEELKSGDHGPEWLYEELSELGQGYVDDGIPGWGYDPNQAAWLVAIQRRFSALYHEQAARTQQVADAIIESATVSAATT